MRVDHPARPPGRGFTLIELMIAVAIVALLAAVALPSFLDSIRKSRRAEAFGAISAVQQAQERWRSGRTTYCSNLSAAPTADPPGLNFPGTTANGYYTLALSGVSGTGYTITATAASSQTADTRCKLLAAEVNGGNLRYGSGSSSSIDWADPNRCWAK
ncbi:MAG: type IV pilin protein [Rubrivivax sp.]|nr:type IV pilin protein [Rubrivivax sp.]